MRAVREGALARGGPLPAGGPVAMATITAAPPEHGLGAETALTVARPRDGLGAETALTVAPPEHRLSPENPLTAVLPEYGVGPERALASVLRQLAAGAADPAHPWCAGHLHCPPLAVAAAADLAASVLNPSMDSWDQAPSATALETAVTAALAETVYRDADSPDAVITTGGTESNLLALLLAREATKTATKAATKAAGRVQPVCGRTAHHSVARAAWLLGLPSPVTVDGARMTADALDAVLAGIEGPTVVVATAGSTGTGSIDPLPAIAHTTRRHGARLHVDAAYGGGVLFSDLLRPLLDGVELADTVALDLHKFGWQPIAAGALAVQDAAQLRPLSTTADYLNAADDTQAGLPDLLGRSLRTSRRADAVKIAVTFAALGRTGLAALVERCCATAAEVAARIEARPELRLLERPELSTVVFRPAGASDGAVADLRRQLLERGHAVLGRTTTPDGLWLKLTVLNPTATADDYDDLVAGCT